MRGFLQVVCVMAIALGAGLFAFGNYYEPRLDLNDPAKIANYMNDYGRAGSGDRIAASLARGFGIGFMTLGVLGLAVPWVNLLLLRKRERETPPPLNVG